MKTYEIGRVYKITNSIDDKLYIGSTTDTLSRRMSNHKMHCKNGCQSQVYKHMREIGVQNFNIVILERFQDVLKEDLKAREDYYIKLFNTVRNGLNSKYEDYGICEHNKNRAYCKECGGSAICPHNKQKAFCVECKGTAMCCHGRQKAYCKICHGSGVCQHNKFKNSCKLCSAGKYKCDICNKTYCSKYVLEGHNKKKHTANVVVL